MIDRYSLVMMPVSAGRYDAETEQYSARAILRPGPTRKHATRRTTKFY
jgi:hypothetical protein